MALRTAAEFLAGLRDNREVYYRGQKVSSVVDHPELGVAARHASIDFEMAENPKFRGFGYSPRRLRGIFRVLPRAAQLAGFAFALKVDRSRHGRGCHARSANQGNWNGRLIRADTRPRAKAAMPTVSSASKLSINIAAKRILLWPSHKRM